MSEFFCDAQELYRHLKQCNGTHAVQIMETRFGYRVIKAVRVDNQDVLAQVEADERGEIVGFYTKDVPYDVLWDDVAQAWMEWA